MVLTLIESFDVDVIKVTIKEKPDLTNQADNEEVEREVVRNVFNALRENARRGRRISDLRIKLEAERSKIRLKRCFETWHKYAKKKANETDENKMSKEKRIELFVKAIAEKQKVLQTEGQKQPPDKPSSRSKSIAPKTGGKLPRDKSSDKPVIAGVNKPRAYKLVTSVVKNRLEAQKQIIQEQRARLAEQSRLIQNMKMQEIDQEVKRTTMRTIGVAKEALNHCDPKTKRSLIHLIREQGCRDEALTEIPAFPNTSGFLSRMEERAKVRKEKIRQFELIRQQKREIQKKKEEQSRLAAEEEERKRQVQLMEEARRFRKQVEERRIKELERNKKSNDLADRCYKRYLFRRYIKEPLGSLVKYNRELINIADEHYREVVLGRVFAAWKSEWLRLLTSKLELADKFYRRNLLWYPFDDWRNITIDIKLKYQVATDFYDLKLQENFMRPWFVHYKNTKKSLAKKEIIAVEHYEKRLKSKHLNLWKKFLSISDSVRERELRRSEWRNLIKKFVPSGTAHLAKIKLQNIPLYY